MEIFLCWSEAASHVLAQGLYQWLPRVIQAAKPFISSEDIRKGRRWHTELATTLAKTNFAILCMTPENLRSEWIHFEAGAVSKNMEAAHISALLLDVKESDLSGPLSQFQNTLPVKEQVEKLVTAINAAVPGERRISADNLKWSFDRSWPDFEALLQRAREKLKEVAPPPPPKRDSSELLEDVLTVVDPVKTNRSMGLF